MIKTLKNRNTDYEAIKENLKTINLTCHTIANKYGRSVWNI